MNLKKKTVNYINAYLMVFINTDYVLLKCDHYISQYITSADVSPMQYYIIDNGHYTNAILF